MGGFSVSFFSSAIFVYRLFRAPEWARTSRAAFYYSRLYLFSQLLFLQRQSQNQILQIKSHNNKDSQNKNYQPYYS